MRRREFVGIAVGAGVGSPAFGQPAFQPLWNGINLSDFRIDTPELWSVEEGMIVGRSPGIKYNEFLRTKKSYGDFHLKAEFRMTDPTGKANSGIQFRSKETEPPSHEVVGYQADLGLNYWGCLYDESRRRKVLVQAPESVIAKIDKAAWNVYEVEARGPRIVLRLNGMVTVDYLEAETGIEQSGFIALQLHSGPPLEMRWRGLVVREL
ncbi:MAG: DUF1080 domain-containing protein [Acidobacteria bacterium]|nr:DUF1080 domain-containing protein [Acidobacteriota bacterium]